MAIMIPDRPIDIEKASLEDVMFEALEKLPDDYYVFHSFKILNCDDGFYHESETDFIIFNAKKGIICLEAKAGKNIQRRDDGMWYYSSGIKMGNNGPYNQAASNMWKLKRYAVTLGLDDVMSKCKMLSAVWFPSISKDNLYRVNLPSEADRKITLTAEALEDPQKYIDEIYDIEFTAGTKTILSVANADLLVQKLLCPSFDLIPTVTFKNDQKKKIFNRLLDEQKRLLDYLVDQPSGVINGAAGTGKTMLGIEMARRWGESGERVLFLCYNKYLQKNLKKSYENIENVDFYTIDGLACKMCKTDRPDYTEFCRVLEDCFYSGTFGYRHVIIDEGQDFGQVDSDENNVIDLLEMNVLENESFPGTFYVFYDKLQLVQGKQVPKYILNSDCKLTLYKNCRNTLNIAKASLRPLGETNRKVEVRSGAVGGELPLMSFCAESEVKNAVDQLIARFKDNGDEYIVILTYKTEENSALSEYIDDGFYKFKRSKCLFTTCRKFKGLEADAIIIIDVDETLYNENDSRRFYVGTSRARFDLGIISTMNEDSCKELLEKHELRVGKNPYKSMAAALNSIYYEV